MNSRDLTALQNPQLAPELKKAIFMITNYYLVDERIFLIDNRNKLFRLVFDVKNEKESYFM